MAGQKKAVGKPHGTGTKRKVAGRGAAKLKKAAGETLDEHSEQIAKSLLNRTLEGNVPIIRLLLELAEGAVGAGKKRHLHSVAKVLAAEPVWDAAETAAGQRAPEV